MDIWRELINNFANFSIRNISCRYSLEAPDRGGTNEYLQHMFLWRNDKNKSINCQTPILIRLLMMLIDVVVFGCYIKKTHFEPNQLQVHHHRTSLILLSYFLRF